MNLASPYQGYLYVALWLIIGLILLVSGFKSQKLLIPLSLFFFFLGGWNLANLLTDTDLFSGIYIWIFRIIAIIFLILVIAIFIYNRRKRQNTEDKNSDN